MKSKRYALKDSESGRRDVYDLIVPDSELDRAVLKDLIIGDWLKSLVEQTGHHDAWDFHKLLNWGDLVPEEDLEMTESSATIAEAFVSHGEHPRILFAVEILPAGAKGYATQVIYIVSGKVYFDFVKAKEIVAEEARAA